MDAGTGTATDPVALHRLDRVSPIEQFEIVDQPIGIRGDPHHPLAHVALEDGEVAAVGAPVGCDFLIGNDGSQTRAPVDRRLAHIRQAMTIDDRVLLGDGQVNPELTVRRRPLA